MEFSRNWLADYVELPDLEELSRGLTEVGLTEEGLAERAIFLVPKTPRPRRNAMSLNGKDLQGRRQGS